MQRVLACWLLFAAASGETPAGEPPERPPQVKEFHRGAAYFQIPDLLEVKATEKAQERLQILSRRLEGTSISLRVTPLKTSSVHVVVIGDLQYEARLVEVPPREEGYLLEVQPKGVILLGRDLLGLQWGLYKLAEALDVKRRRIACFTARDWPDMRVRGVHIFLPKEKELELFGRFVDEVLLPFRFNTLVVEVNWSVAYQSHPEVCNPDARSKQFCSQLADLVRSRGLFLCVEFNCLGHQSWGARKGGLLRAYPQFDETPQLPSDDPRLYCRSWCPRHPELTPILYDLWQELLDVFRPDGFHLGMDEVFLIAEKDCPRCSGSTPAEIFYSAAAQYSSFFKGAGCKVFLWGDRLLEAKRFGYSKYESSETDTWRALSYLPRDLILCDWHYGVRREYPSIPYFLKEGFSVLACPWRNPKNVIALWNYARKVRTGRFLGFLATTWVDFGDVARALLGKKASSKAKEVAACLKLVGRLCWEGKTQSESK